MTAGHAPRVLALVQAGGRGTRMDVLTRETPKPALPFAGTYRLIDFPLSNLRHSEISDVWLSVQYLAQDLAEVVANGKPWDLDRHRGGFRLVVPQQGAGAAADEGFVSGNAEELLQNRDAIRRFGADAVVVMSADHVYRLDYRAVVADHLEHGAECTIVTTEVGLDDAAHHAVIGTDDRGRVTRLDYKPDRPDSGTVATEVFVYQPDALVEVLEEQHRRLSLEESAEDGSALGDFGEHLLPALIERGRVHAYPLAGYWRDLGRPETYVAAHRELLLNDDLDLFSPDWPITTLERQQPVRIEDGASVSTSLLGPGAHVGGVVRRSVLGPGVVVEAGAEVVDAILFADVVVAAGARVEWAVVADGCRVEAGAVVGQRRVDEDAGLGADELVLLGPGCSVGSGASLGRGARLEPGTVT